MFIRDVFPRFCYDTDTTALRIIGRFGWVRLGLHEYGKIKLRFTKTARNVYESVKNMPNVLRITYE